ncbi:MAG: YebC/PmpR family DNA-binding transcriptional regulator, partial [Pseudomonadota bacterium]
FEKVRKAFEATGLAYNLAEVSMIPQNTVRLDGKKAEQMLNLMEALEENDDINHVYANFDIPDDVIEAMG